MRKTASQIADTVLIKSAEPSWLKEMEPQLQEKVRTLRRIPYEQGAQGAFSKSKLWGPLEVDTLKSLNQSEIERLHDLKLLVMRTRPMPVSGRYSFKLSPDRYADPLSIPASEQLRQHRDMVDDLRRRRRPAWIEAAKGPQPRQRSSFKANLPKDPVPVVEAASKGRLRDLGKRLTGLLSARLR